MDNQTLKVFSLVLLVTITITFVSSQGLVVPFGTTGVNYSINVNYSDSSGDAHLFDGYSVSSLYTYYKGLLDSIFAPIDEPLSLHLNGDNSPTASIDWGGQNITNADIMTASYFFGNGSQLTNIDHSALSNLNWAAAGHTIDADLDMNGNDITNVEKIFSGTYIDLYPRGVTTRYLRVGETPAHISLGSSTGLITVDSSLIPSPSDNNDLGLSTYKWKDLFLSNEALIDTMTIGGGSITDSSGAISFGDENLTTTGALSSGNINLGEGKTLQIGSTADPTTSTINFGDGTNVRIEELSADTMGIHGAEKVRIGDLDGSVHGRYLDISTTLVFNGNLNIGNTLSLSSGQISDTTGTISFVNENLETTGNISGEGASFSDVDISSGLNLGDGNLSMSSMVGDGALHLDGTDDVVTCGGDNDLNFYSEDFSYSAWFNITSNVGAPVLISKYGTEGDCKYCSYMIRFNPNGNDKICAYLRDDDGSNTGWVCSTTSISEDKWYHVAITQSPSSDYVRIYLDGVLENSKYITTLDSIYPQATFTIGAYRPNHASYFTGEIDNVAIFSKELSLAEIVAMNNSGRDATKYLGVNMLSQWRFEGGTARDEQNAHNGVFHADAYANGSVDFIWDFTGSIRADDFLYNSPFYDVDKTDLKNTFKEMTYKEGTAGGKWADINHDSYGDASVDVNGISKISMINLQQMLVSMVKSLINWNEKQDVEISFLKSELCKKDNTYSWCIIK